MIIKDLSNSDYHARDEMSNSQLKLLGTSPAHYKYGRSDIGYETARIGTVIHSVILEGGKGTAAIDFDRKRSSNDDKQAWADYFKSAFDVDIDTTRSCKTWHEQFEIKTGLSIVTVEEQSMISDMMESLDKNQLACDLLKDCEPEVSVFNELHGVDCRSRPDKSNKQRIVDVKSCFDPSARAFAKDCAKYGYHRQEAFYSQMHENEYSVTPEFSFIAVGKKAPYPVVVYQLSNEAKENGAYLVERDLQKYKDCLASKKWESFENQLDLSIPIYEAEVFEYDLGDEVLVA